MIIRQKEPANYETRFDEDTPLLTPAAVFYIRSHFAVPPLTIEDYTLRVDGQVRDQLALSYQELKDMPSVTVMATLECAGNSRVFLVPAEEGAQWGLGAVGNAEWTGVPLRSVLERAGLEPGVCEVVLEGADGGKPKEKPMPPGEISYARSLPLEKAMSEEVVLAYAMNGRELRREHGFPVRAVVPGHYGMASVKWLRRVTATAKPFTGYWQTSDYAYWDKVADLPVRRGLGEMKVKSEIFSPGAHEVVAANEPVIVRGAAWSGKALVTGVEVSCDGGANWMEARFVDAARQWAWRRWEFVWQTPREATECTLLSRATDASGATQPAEHDARFGSYCIHHALPIEVTVGTI